MLAGQAVQRAKVVQYLACGQASIQRGGTGEIADMLAHLLRLGADIVTGDGGIACGGRENGAQHTQQSGLAGTIDPQNAEHLSRLRLEAHLLERKHLSPLAVGEDFA